MSLGPVMLDIAAESLTAEDRELLMHPAVGGVILFSRNYQSREQLNALTAEIRALRPTPLLIATDHEGGRVQRFREGFSVLPPAMFYQQLYQQQGTTALKIISSMAWLMASELQATGVDFSFAPVLDLDYGLNSAIGDRAFAQTPEQVTLLTQTWLQGVRLAGMAAVGKHFPGHGAVSTDSHLALPEDQRPLKQLYDTDLKPFQSLIQQGLEAVMPAHIVFPAIDHQPAGFSPLWLKDILRQQMGFQGVVISDALDMLGAAAIGDTTTRAKAALEAGCDLLLLCNDRPAAIRVLDALSTYHHPLSQQRLLRLYSRHFIDWHTLTQQPLWQQAQQHLQLLHEHFAGDEQPNPYWIAAKADPTTRGGTVL